MKARSARKGKGKDKDRREKNNHPYQTFSTTTVNEYFMQKIANRLVDGWHKSGVVLFVTLRSQARNCIKTAFQVYAPRYKTVHAVEYTSNFVRQIEYSTGHIRQSVST